MAANKSVYQVSTTSGSDTESHSDYDSDTQDWPDPEHEKLIEDFEAHLNMEQQMALYHRRHRPPLRGRPDWAPTPDNTKH